MPEITKGLLRAALDCHLARLVHALGPKGPLMPLEVPGDIERMFRDVKAIKKELYGLYEAEIAKEKMRLDGERIGKELQRQRSGEMLGRTMSGDA